MSTTVQILNRPRSAGSRGLCPFGLASNGGPFASSRERLGNASGRVRRAIQSAVGPFHRIGLLRIDLVAFQTPEFGLAHAVGRCHQKVFALRAAVIIHGSLPIFGKFRS
jgi:hypothetical protein